MGQKTGEKDGLAKDNRSDLLLIGINETHHTMPPKQHKGKIQANKHQGRWGVGGENDNHKYWAGKQQVEVLNLSLISADEEYGPNRCRNRTVPKYQERRLQIMPVLVRGVRKWRPIQVLIKKALSRLQSAQNQQFSLCFFGYYTIFNNIPLISRYLLILSVANKYHSHSRGSWGGELHYRQNCRVGATSSADLLCGTASHQ